MDTMVVPTSKVISFTQVKEAQATESEIKKVVSFDHVKKNDPKDIPPPVPKRIMAWPGGKIKSNKDEALAKFVEKLEMKQSQGILITEAQRKIIREWRQTNPKRQGKTSGKKRKPVLGPPVNSRKTSNKRRIVSKAQNTRKISKNVKGNARNTKGRKSVSKIKSSTTGKKNGDNNVHTKLLSGLSSGR